MGIKENLLSAFPSGSFNLKQAYEVNPSVNRESVRARIYENLGVVFERISKSVYATKDASCILIEGNGRDLSSIKSDTVDSILTDHPWLDEKSNQGGNRNFTEYECFNYEPEDFKQKFRILKQGGFLVEFIPAENENNFDYLYQIKKMALEAGFEYYAKVTWIKGNFVSNTGRKSKNTEEIMIFSKGKARELRLDAKRTKATGKEVYMSGTRGMLPTDFNVDVVSKKERICQSQKPVMLLEQILEYITLPGELVVDQFAGSGAVAEACIRKKRRCILFEKARTCVSAIIDRLDMEPVY